jgi:prevent-host-death family protein
MLESGPYSGLEIDQEAPMKNVLLSQDVLPLGEFKTQASRVLRKLKENQRPVIITQNGRAAAVLITPEEFDQLHERERFMGAVQEGLADSEAGRIIEDDEMERLLDEKFGSLKGA